MMSKSWYFRDALPAIVFYGATARDSAFFTRPRLFRPSSFADDVIEASGARRRLL